MSSTEIAQADENSSVPRSDTRGDEVFDKILNMILTCELPPGAFVNESTLATAFGVSRGPVREAIRRLQGIQLVTREPYVRARVVTLTRRGVVELFETREALEGFSCRLAAQNMTDVKILALEQDVERARQPDAAPFDFHERIVREGGNQRIISILCGDLYHLLRIYRRMSGAVPERKEVASHEHWQIIRALKIREAELAESLMRSHIRRASEQILSSGSFED
ncbi:GntR family transcriptional regulator [Xinfangfangia sp. CPCC 101601]|uniref:GntR family transcriptional regulator n=1 Tax=Pseudogemmobacter lacusdianii TaxID=3069608 RepID=A0ABU0W1T4_9RHOB|nr:GntR family transcriptional regulator [Xinfangfangia sp. CPCC 101601]MDQ2067937.1 GntR family transcriptional regulator [Xinfangfangia sp. CPCC 101601]